MHLFVFFVVVVVPSFGNTEGTVEWDYYYGANASTESEAGPVDTKVKNVILFSIIIWLNLQAGKMKRLATRAGKMGLSCPLAIFRGGPARLKRTLFGRMVNPLLTKLVRSKMA